MWLTGEYAEAVLKAAREWHIARMGVLAQQILDSVTTPKGSESIGDRPVADRLADAEAALSAAVVKHRSVDP